MGSATVCPHCGFGPSKSIVGKTTRKVAKLTGEALEAGVIMTETVVRETKPAVKSAVALGKRGVSKARQGTLKAAKALKERGS